MSRKLILGLAAGVGLSVLTAAAQAAIYSPTQAQLSSVAFTDFWPGNGAALNSITPVGTDGVEYNFNTGFASPTPDSYSRSQFEAPFTQNLSGLSGFGIDFQVPTGGSVNGSQLQAQIYLRYTGGSGFSGSGGVNINSTGRTSVLLNLATIPAASLSQVTAFGIEIFSNGDPAPLGVDMGDKVRAFTSPQPPTYNDGFQISDFEGTDAGTWGPSFQPDHVHTIVTADGSPFNNGVTKGTHALQIARTYTGDSFPIGGTNTSFRWGSQMVLNSSTGAAATGDYNNNGKVDAADYTTWRDHLNQSFALPNRAVANTGPVSAADYTTWKTNFGQTGGGTDPVVQGKINSLVDAINAAAPTGRIAFDVSFQNVDQFPNANPGFLGFELFISDGRTGTGGGSFYQASFGFPNLPALGDFYKGVTLSVPISMFKDQSANNFGNLGVGGVLLQKNSTFTMGLASNTNGNATFVIDNIRVQTLAPGSASAVPEPSSIGLALMGVVLGMMGFQRRK